MTRARAWWIGGLVLFAVGLTIRLVLVANRPEPPEPPGPPVNANTTLLEAPPAPDVQRPGQVRASVVSVRGRIDGAGFVLDDSGHVLTGHHVVDGAPAVTVTGPDGGEVTAEVVGSDAASNVAVLRIAAPLPPLPLGRSADVRVGDAVTAVGSPSGAVVTGIVTAVGREMRIDGVLRQVLQTDAAVGEGNSGGPLVNGKGEVIGVNTALTTADGAVGLGFAIPIDVAAAAAERIIG